MSTHLTNKDRQNKELMDKLYAEQLEKRNTYGDLCFVKGHALKSSVLDSAPDLWAVVHVEHGGPKSLWHNGVRCGLCKQVWCVRCQEIPPCLCDFCGGAGCIVYGELEDNSRTCQCKLSSGKILPKYEEYLK